MPKVTSKVFKLNCDDADPYVAFKDSQYYRQKHYLKGQLSKQGLQELRRNIKNLDEHNRKKYALSPNPELRREQVNDLIGGMHDAIEASRLEALILNGEPMYENRKTKKQERKKIKPKDEVRMRELLGKYS